MFFFNLFRVKPSFTFSGEVRMYSATAFFVENFVKKCTLFCLCHSVCVMIMVKDFGSIHPEIKLIPLIHRLNLEDLVCQILRNVLDCLLPPAKARYVNWGVPVDGSFL